MNNPTPPEVVEQWRAEFESIMLEKFKELKIDFVRTEIIKAGWNGFLMARQSVVIELPEKYGDNVFTDEYEKGFNDCIDHCSWKIEAHGYAVSRE